MMEPTSTRPTIGAAVDGRIAVGVADPVEFSGDQRDCLRPVDRDEGLEAAELAAGPMTFREIGCPDHRAQYPRRALHRVDDRAADRRRRRITVEWVKANEDVAIISRDIRAPMGRKEPSFRNRGHACLPQNARTRRHRPSSAVQLAVYPFPLGGGGRLLALFCRSYLGKR